MNRRSFTKLTALATASLMIPLSGCSVNVKDLLNTVIDAVKDLLQVAEPGVGWATALAQALSALEQAEQQWESGGATAIVIDVLNTIENILAVIPLTAIYSPLIDLLVAGIEELLANLPINLKLGTVTVAQLPNQHRGRTKLNPPSWHQTYRGAFKKQWNDLAVGLNLSSAKI